MSRIQILSMLFVTSLLSGCFTYEYEIASSSVKLVKRSNIGSYIGVDVDLPLVKYWVESDFIVVGIYSKQNLLALAKEDGFSLYPEIYFCGNPGEVALLGIHEVYQDGESIGSKRLKKNVNEEKIESALYKYDVVIFTKWDKERELPKALSSEERQKQYLKYDLKEKPQDICLRLRGSDMVRNYKTNLLVIPKSKVNEMVKD